MNGSNARSGRALICALSLAVLAMWVTRAAAFPSYDDGAGHGCVQCHYNASASGGFTGGPSVGLLHLKHLNTFGITSCALCHATSAGGDLPVLTYFSGDGYGCAGCHGVDYGETSINSGRPKSTAYGLRLAHALAGVTLCSTCHYPGSPETGEPNPAPAVLPETVPPPYYGRSTVNLTDPCSSAQESFDATVGLDNDGNGLADMADPACAARGPMPTVTPGAPTPTPTATPTLFAGTGNKVTKVHPGESIQAAVDAAAPGGVIYVMPGTYEETHSGLNAVNVNKDGIRLIGRKTKTKKVILQAHPGQKNGIVVEPIGAPRIHGFHIKGFTIQNFPNNGIITRYVDNFSIVRNESIDNKENGIWPTLSAKGLVSRNVSYGSDDSAMWVETSVNIRILNNVTYDSPTGLELSNSDDILVKGNESYNNAVGIGLYMQPGLARKQSNRWNVVKNYTHDNNRPNTAPPGSMAADLPPGGGILVLGIDNSVLKNNKIENNGFYGIAVVDYCLAMALGAYNCTDNPPDFDPYPDNDKILSNNLVNNGTNPPIFPLMADAADIVVLGQGNNNCFSGNTYSTQYPALPYSFDPCL